MVLLLVMIGIAITVRRALVVIPILLGEYILPMQAQTQLPVPDEGFAKHPLLTLIHILPGFFFVVLGPLQFSRRIRSRRPAVHRYLGRVVFFSGLVVGLSALWMGFRMSIGGVSEMAATILFGLIFLVALLKAFVHIRRRRVGLHREWMIRAFAIGLAVATTRPIVGLFFATSRITGLTVAEFFGTAFWIAFTLHLIAAEVWINYTRPANLQSSLLAHP